MIEKKERKLHTFAICAYGDSPYLEECMASLACQRQKSEIICCTSTPSPYIEELAEKYRIPLYVREGESGIREDWLFAYRKASGDLVTIAHQDDRYEKRYAETLFSMYEKYPDMTVFCSDYATLRMERETEAPKLQLVNAVWLVKKLLRLPLRFVCSERPLIFYRVHPGATTKQCIEDNRRKNDETAMFRKMWPESMVKLFMHFYKKAYRAYEK